MAKRVYLSREHMWMRRGMQDHVAAPHGPARVPVWHRGRVAQHGALDRDRDEDRASMRWMRGPPDLQSSTRLKNHLSESIRAVDRASYNS